MSSGRDEMMSRWSEEAQQEKKLTEVAHRIDNFLAQESLDHGFGPLSLSAIVIARLVRLNMEVGNEQDLFKLMNEVTGGNLTLKERMVQ